MVCDSKKQNKTHTLTRTMSVYMFEYRYHLTELMKQPNLLTDALHTESEWNLLKLFLLYTGSPFRKSACEHTSVDTCQEKDFEQVKPQPIVDVKQVHESRSYVTGATILT